MANIQAIKGFADLFADDSRLFTKLENTARDIFFRCGFTELRTPLMEYTDLFCRGIGTETDVVQKEMYSLPDSKGRSMSLRPEATAGVMRAYIENNVHARESVSKFFTTGPMFRHERPQKGRMRQFHQINCECLGPKEPEADAELISMLMEFLGAIGISDVTLHINSLGCPECRPKYRQKLHGWLETLNREELCDDCKRRMDTNPLRVLDCKVPSCKTLTAGAPVILDSLCPDCKEHFETVLGYLDAQGIPYELDHRLVRGLDYYTRTTFEVVSNNIGSQGSIAGGGRYDGLIEQLGGPSVPGIGFACGMERLALLMQAPEAPKPDFFAAALDESCKDAVFGLVSRLRAAKLTGTMSFETRSMKSAMRQAGKLDCRFVALIGERELADGTVLMKNMESGEQQIVKADDAASLFA
ncbi:MAG: histidine--tRNA ligase [Mailhella sp.]|nr:histidine--tRNA ligase [Mailhella sp.]